jgi:hypothetical protein
VRSIAISFFISSIGVLAQNSPQSYPEIRSVLPPGATKATISVHVGTPRTEGDEISFGSETLVAGVTIVTPSGQRLNDRNVEKSGFGWWLKLPITPHLGSADAGYWGCFHLSPSAPAGTYTVEFELTSPVVQAVAISAGFVSQRARDDVLRTVTSNLYFPQSQLHTSTR